MCIFPFILISQDSENANQMKLVKSEEGLKKCFIQLPLEMHFSSLLLMARLCLNSSRPSNQKKENNSAESGMLFKFQEIEAQSYLKLIKENWNFAMEKVLLAIALEKIILFDSKSSKPKDAEKMHFSQLYTKRDSIGKRKEPCSFMTNNSKSYQSGCTYPMNLSVSQNQFNQRRGLFLKTRNKIKVLAQIQQIW